MNLLSWVGQRLTMKNSGRFWSDYYGSPSWAGEPITPDIAMQLSAVWKCVRLTATTMASLPLNFVAADGSGATDPNMAIQRCVSVRPNSRMSAFDFWEAIIGAMELAGDGFARKDTVGVGAAKEVIGLTLLHPWGMRWDRSRSGAEVRWIYTDLDGKQMEFLQSEIFHVKNFSFDGVKGLSTVAYGAQTLGGARAADRTASTMFKSGLSASGFLEAGQVLNAEDRERLQSIINNYTGVGGIGRVMVLEGGMTFKPLSIDPEDAQLLLSRKWNVEEICRWFDIPPVLAGHNPEGGTMWGSGVEQVVLAWYMLGLRNRIRRLQSAIQTQLLNPAQQARWVPRYNIDALLQGDSTARIAFIAQGVQNGVLNRNEGRAKLDLPPFDGGDIFTAQVNLAPVDSLGDNPGNDSQARTALRTWLGLEDGQVPPEVERTAR